MAENVEIKKQLDELEARRRRMQKQREECEAQLEQIDEALFALKNEQDQRVKDITDVVPRDV